MDLKGKEEAVVHLTSVFRGGRISGWVVRNRSALTGGDGEELDLDQLLLLLCLSQGFAERVYGLTKVEKTQLIRKALIRAGESSLSATRLTA